MVVIFHSFSYVYQRVCHHRQPQGGGAYPTLPSTALSSSSMLPCSVKHCGLQSVNHHHLSILTGTRPGKHTKSYWKWPSRNSEFSQLQNGDCSIVFCKRLPGRVNHRTWQMASIVMVCNKWPEELTNWPLKKQPLSDFGEQRVHRAVDSDEIPSLSV